MKRFRRSRWSLAIGIALSLAFLPRAGGLLPLPSVTTAFAASACGSNSSTNPTHYFTGWQDYVDGGWGSSAWIVTRVPAFCTGTNPLGSSDFITAWSMVTGANAVNYAQSGYTISPGQSTPEIFAENTDTGCSGGFCDTYGPTTSGGDNRQYWQDYDTYGFKSIDMGYGSTVLAVTGYDPANNCGCNNHWTGPWGHQYYGENLNTGDDMPGLSTQKATFTSVAYLVNINSTGATPPSFSGITSHSASSSKSYWCVQKTTTTSFNIWTDGTCPSPS